MEKVPYWATSTDTKGFCKEKTVYEIEKAQEDSFFTMDETSGLLCVLFWFCVLPFACQQRWQELKELCCACLRKH